MSSQSCIEKDSDKLVIMSSHSCIDKDSDERYQRDNYDDTEKKISENDEETLIGYKYSYKRDKIDWVDNKKYDEKYQIKTSK